MTLYTQREEIEKLIYHAGYEKPNECIGLFMLAPYDEKGNWLLADVVPCKNVSRTNKDESAQISRVKIKNFNKRFKEFEPLGFRYGTYHSHPKFGKCQLSEKDESIGKVYKQFTFQIIIAKTTSMEFTIQKGKLWMLQTRTGKRTAAAAVKIAVDLVGEGLITKEEAVLRVRTEEVDQLLHPSFDPDAKLTATEQGKLLAHGLNASPGAATWRPASVLRTAQGLSSRPGRLSMLPGYFFA